MNINGGASELSGPLREVYSPLFTASHTPYKEGSDTLKNLFHIHSGGSPTTLDFQIQTFKALAESTNFEQVPSTQSGGQPTMTPGVPSGIPTNPALVSTPVHINLHIHLPENKTRRDYEAIIEDIGRYIFGRNLGEHNE